MLKWLLPQLCLLFMFTLTAERTSAQVENYLDKAFRFYGISKADNSNSLNDVLHVRPDGAVRTMKEHNLQDAILFKRAKETGLAGSWAVLSTKKEGEFSRAQIGQEPGDVITVENRNKGSVVPIS